MSKTYKVLLLIFSLFALLVLMNHYAPSNTLDSRIKYTYSEALEYFDQLSPVQRVNYAKTEALDFLFIINYTFLLFLLMSWAFPDVRWILFFVFLPGAFDFVETLTIFVAMATENPNFLYAELGVFTFLKWMSGIAVVAMTLMTLSLRKTRIHS